jgi:hypothetical protein
MTENHIATVELAEKIRDLIESPSDCGPCKAARVELWQAVEALKAIKGVE